MQYESRYFARSQATERPEQAWSGVSEEPPTREHAEHLHRPAAKTEQIGYTEAQPAGMMYAPYTAPFYPPGDAAMYHVPQQTGYGYGAPCFFDPMHYHERKRYVPSAAISEIPQLQGLYKEIPDNESKHCTRIAFEKAANIANSSTAYSQQPVMHYPAPASMYVMPSYPYAGGPYLRAPIYHDPMAPYYAEPIVVKQEVHAVPKEVLKAEAAISERRSYPPDTVNPSPAKSLRLEDEPRKSHRDYDTRDDQLPPKRYRREYPTAESNNRKGDDCYSSGWGGRSDYGSRRETDDRKSSFGYDKGGRDSRSHEDNYSKSSRRDDRVDNKRSDDYPPRREAPFGRDSKGGFDSGWGKDSRKENSFGSDRKERSNRNTFDSGWGTESSLDNNKRDRENKSSFDNGQGSRDKATKNIFESGWGVELKPKTKTIFFDSGWGGVKETTEAKTATNSSSSKVSNFMDSGWGDSQPAPKAEVKQSKMANLFDSGWDNETASEKQIRGSNAGKTEAPGDNPPSNSNGDRKQEKGPVKPANTFQFNSGWGNETQKETEIRTKFVEKEETAKDDLDESIERIINESLASAGQTSSSTASDPNTEESDVMAEDTMTKTSDNNTTDHFIESFSCEDDMKSENSMPESSSFNSGQDQEVEEGESVEDSCADDLKLAEELAKKYPEHLSSNTTILTHSKGDASLLKMERSTSYSREVNHSPEVINLISDDEE
ncbi:hypothetical protein MP638_005671 [Amoeboaphelidium occidentale]|nr:hypothetical protein MP638_005671 [Amoeboaphelidium occidentale]